MMQSLIVFVYNQIDFVEQLSRNLKSLVDEFDEIIIVDDCSCDGTVEALIASRIFEFGNVVLHVNPENLGINRNFSFHVLRCEADVVTLIGGDDQIELCYGKKIRNLVENRKFQSCDRFVIISNVRYSGVNQKVIRNYSSPARLTKEYLLNVLTGTLQPFETPTSKELSCLVGGWQDKFGLQADVARQLRKFYMADHVEFIDEVGVVYEPNIGITSRTLGTKNLSDFIVVCQETVKFVSPTEKALVTPLIDYLILLHSVLVYCDGGRGKKRKMALHLIRKRFLLCNFVFNNPLFSWRLCLIVFLKAFRS